MSNRCGARLNTDELRILKHEMRTPLNHIVGYSALVLETAREMEDTELAERVTEIQSAASVLTKAMDILLVEWDGTMAEGMQETMRAMLIPARKKLAAMLLRSSQTPCAALCALDLLRIRNATERLDAFLASIGLLG